MALTFLQRFFFAEELRKYIEIRSDCFALFTEIIWTLLHPISYANFREAYSERFHGTFQILDP